VKHQYKSTEQFLICGDINTDYFTESNRKNQLSSLETTYNLLYTVNFTTRIQNNSRTTIDNTFEDSSKINLSTVSSILNGLSYNIVQILTIKNVYATINKSPLKQRTRLIDNGTITNFQTLLTKET
jgi:hypothetical protein